MRIVDADILSYGLLENHVATPYTRPLIERGIKGDLEVYVTATTLLETYNTLLWHYRVRPKINVARKIWAVAEGLNLIPPSDMGFKISVKENVPLGDAILLATALDNRIPIIVSNDKHIEKLTKEYGLLYENPIPPEIRSQIK
ncbi:type II toxin-antitoxin system VapC family toxin [Candidatus Bathyarchaeota archaeon]|nr:type II toxin-antitoxin system VapC family toxin [Candidatus Bathyarchaeota archaeon]